MGFVSFKTVGGKSIPNNCQEARPTFPVYMHGPGRYLREESYGGYAAFGGKDVFRFLCEMNGLGTEEAVTRFNAFFLPHVEAYNCMNWKERGFAGYPHWIQVPVNEEYEGGSEGVRHIGIMLEDVHKRPLEAEMFAQVFPELGKGCKDLKYPQFTESDSTEGLDFSKPMNSCELQGFFYGGI